MNDTLTRTDFQARFEALLSQLSKDNMIDYAFIDIPSDRKPWLDTGIDLSAGERVTTFAVGKTCLKGTDLWFGADFQLWCRIGPDGEIFRGTRASNTFAVEKPDRLYLASYFPGEWATRTGELATPDEVYEQASGCLAALIVRWRVEPIEGLKRLAALGDVDGLVASEIDRLTDPVVPPPGWNYLWFVGPAEIYRSCRTPEKEPAICCHTHRDVGLLQKDVSLPFEPNTRLRWAWRMDRLPSEVREDTFPTHDYQSIAVEFDNGQDITYYWSAELPVGTAYRCPIPTWTARETHVVIRSGSEGLGEWFSEERDVYRDYLDFIGGPPPARIVRVWLIALSLLQGREGECRYSGIEFVTKEGVTPIQ
ncbi:DUF3047 domain-containing protein [Methylocaldum sp. RMAD-M]|uniref:DUF3047 domain-containing protein n=1 Tax=Methylocaldum sp. RMAD-M TaxID=2806557 RepID=UPI000A3233CD|nr:DUF3047 domain-containing protein [Methylocaldum sp. RMAD-M]MBP1148310.1 hypothetical protein [Methylocaldum sp. RMAD-M]